MFYAFAVFATLLMTLATTNFRKSVNKNNGPVHLTETRTVEIKTAMASGVVTKQTETEDVSLKSRSIDLPGYNH